jgi:NADH-quinone oxidoreductase subunit K
MQAGINHYIFLSAILLGFGIYTVIAFKNIIRILFGITMIFTASIINIAAFSGFKNFNPEGQIFIYTLGGMCLLILFIGIILAYNYYKETNSTELNND